MILKFVSAALLGFLAFGLSPAQVAQTAPPGASSSEHVAGEKIHQPAWLAQAKPAKPETETNLPPSVLLARQRRFQNFFGANMDAPGKENIGSRTYIFHTPTEPIPITKSTTIVVATPIDYQPYMAKNNSSVYTDLSLNVENYIFQANAIPESAKISILYSGGSIKTSSGNIAETGIAHGSTPLDVGHKYLLFLNYEPATQSFNILRAWDLSSSKPVLLDENGTVSALNDKQDISDENALKQRVQTELAFQNPASVR
jgi:hypothetical protein